MYTQNKKILFALLCSTALFAGCGGGGSSSNDDNVQANPNTDPNPAPGADSTPNPFNFTDQSGVATSTVITSVPVTITGINAPATVTVTGTGGSYSVGCTATFISTGSTISNNQTVCVRHTSAATNNSTTNTTLTVGGVSDIFTSTTSAAAASVVGLLPFLTGTGQLRLLDPTAAIVLPDTNPKTVDSGLAPPPLGTGCNDCFGQAEAFFTGTVSGSTVSSLHAARLAYAKRAVGNDSGGMVFKLNITRGAPSNLPVRISSLANACRIIKTETTDLLAIDNSAVVVERAGADLLCSETADNVVTVIRLNTLSTAGNNGIDIPLALEVNNPLHARTNASGVITGYVSFETNGINPILVHRSANLVADPAPLLVLEQTTGASIERTDLTHLFVTATPDDDSMKLFRVEGNGGLSPVLYSFAGFNAGNPIQDGLHDATNLYFADANQLLRIPVNSIIENAGVITTMGSDMVIGKRTLDTSTTPGRLVFEALDNGAPTLDSGVFSAAVNASDAPATTLANTPDIEGGVATLVVATHGRAYINIADHGLGGEFPNDDDDALKINTNGTGAFKILSAYWAGSSRATSFDLALVAAIPTQFIFLATRIYADGSGDDTLSVVNPATGVTGAVLGTVSNAAGYEAVKVAGLGRYALARAERDRFGALDNDVYFLDAATAGSLVPLAETDPDNDIPLIAAGN